MANNITEPLIFINPVIKDVVSTISITPDGESTAITVFAPLALLNETYKALTSTLENFPEYQNQLNAQIVETCKLANTMVGERQGRIALALAAEFGNNFTITQHQVPSEKLIEDALLQYQNRIVIEGCIDIELIGSILFSSALINQEFAEKVMSRLAVDEEKICHAKLKPNLLIPVNQLLAAAQ